MPKEIERRYLIFGIPRALQTGMALICQTYVNFDNPEIRIRNENGVFYKNIKSGDGLVRDESLPITISEDEFYFYWNKFPERQIVKVRYRIKVGDLIWELDEFLRPAKGRYIAEVELPSAEIIPPIPAEIQMVMIREITEDKRYRNKNISHFGWPEETS